MTGRGIRWRVAPFRVLPEKEAFTRERNQDYFVRAALFPDKEPGIALYLNQKLQSILPEETVEGLIEHLQVSLDRARKIANE
jgi:hypothetical protein